MGNDDPLIDIAVKIRALRDIRTGTFRQIQQFVIHVRFYPVIAVDKADVFPARLVKAAIAAAGETAVFLFNVPKPGIPCCILPDDFPGPVWTAIIDDDEFNIPASLGDQRIQRLPEIIFHIVNRYDYR